MANFVDFVAACAKDPKLGKEFISQVKGKSGKDLAGWFKSKGYDVADADAEKLAASGAEISNLKEASVQASY